MRAVILPGLDGGAGLRAEFVAALAPRIRAEVVEYPTDRALGYDELLPFVQARLPRGEDFLLIGESFSGPLAIWLAAQRREGLVGLVLCATFARTPVPLASLLRRFAALVPVTSLPAALVARAMMGRWSTSEWSGRLRRALEELDAGALRKRITDVLAVDATAELVQVACPILAIAASSDTLLQFRRGNDIRRTRADATCLAIDGPHMLLQAKPLACAEAIGQWLSMP